MSYFSKLTLADGSQLDAFGRLRTSQPVTLFDNTQYCGDNPLVWENQTAAPVPSPTTPMPPWSTSTRRGPPPRRASSARASGHFTTFQASPRASSSRRPSVLPLRITKRIGYFDAANGVFFEYASGTINVVLRLPHDPAPPWRRG